MKGREWLGYEWSEGDIVKLHHVTINHYTESISLQWYSNRELSIVDKPNWQKLRRFDFDWFATFERQEKQFPVYSDVPMIRHATLWDFYTYIGYDYKKKRYLK
jgi:hypothetical protein